MHLLNKFNIRLLVKAIRLMGKRAWIFLLVIFGFNLVEAVCVPLSAYGLRGAIRGVTNGDALLYRHSIIFFVFSITLWWAYSPGAAYMCDWASKKAFRNIKTDFITHLLHLPQKYHDYTPTGEVLSLVSNDIACIQRIYDWDYFQVVRSAVIGVSALVTMVVMDWRFAGIVFALGTASVLATSRFSKKLEGMGEKLQSRLAQNSTDFYELFKASKAIRLLGLVNHKKAKLRDGTQLEADARVQSAGIHARMNSIIFLIDSLSYVLILICGAGFVYFGLSDWGVITALAGLKYAADDLFSKLGMSMAGMQTSLAGVKRVLVSMEESEESLYKEGYVFCKRLPNPNTVLSLEDIVFSYNGEIDVLKSINLTLETGKLTALLGVSGSGKSTLMKILLSLYEPTGGKVLFRDTGSNTVTLESIRNKTAYVPQEAMLFNGSVYDNIVCGNEYATQADVIAAAVAAEADDFISKLPAGYNTVLADDGKSLSGGQRQRIAIARALVKKAPILLFDEITSALDSESEAKILETVCKLKKDHAVVLISHKPNVEAYADVVMRLGRVN